MRRAICDCSLPGYYAETIKEWLGKDALIGIGAEYFKVTMQVYESLRYHPDIFMCKADEDTLVHSPCFDVLAAVPDITPGVELITGRTSPGRKYPATCSYNVLKAGDFYFHNLRYTDPVLLSVFKERGIKGVHVEQGYTNCSSVVAGSEAIITEDRGIAERARELSFDVLFLQSRCVILRGQKYGFIGGACGRGAGGELYFLGDISLHPEAHLIKEFLDKHSCPYRCVRGQPLIDCGGLVIL
jgi:hypothetical protein